jgi:UDP-N-acetylmuramoyl-tripeptide--D-alanyl-D-alanine ligase
VTAPLWTSAAAAAATGGRATRPFEAAGLSIDSRTLAPGEMFVALADRRDGHEFVADALARGASAALVSRRPDGVGDDAPLLLVDDVMDALRDLARAARARTRAQVLGITGSVGKTSTKEMLRAILGAQGRVHAAERSYNNHWGVPLTLARMPAETDFAVIEIGMNRPGEIAPLARLADLTHALVTTVAPAHLEAFDSVEGIANEKASILEGLRPGGWAILNGDIAHAPILAAKARAVGARPLVFGTAEGADARLTECFLHEAQTVARGTLAVPGAAALPVLFRLQTPGRHFAMNGLAALAAVAAMGGDVAVAMADLGRWIPYDGRGRRESVRLDPADDSLAFDLIDDAYNANPASVGAALEMLAASRPSDGIGRVARGRRIAVIGDMLELGPTEAALHAELAAHPAVAGLDRIHCVGPRARALWEALPPAFAGGRARRYLSQPAFTATRSSVWKSCAGCSRSTPSPISAARWWQCPSSTPTGSLRVRAICRTGVT